ncbi:deoxyguanosinetriphosphate triphosphohydrolase family protein [Rhodoferax sp. U11-2br]|uniref:deoxyguanosinetriphosphate triphosphohydrolase family protein n=1 Tax=Rhodoferax sp. U11-2br TaxID=2838878 RepID=UPI001BE65BE2|nr:dNTP triphosphohydrolase [Rhodoferax sp. U11-2br]MBT3067330.1 dNTP triphosphohydrolase [Rhodoferax sp. U11-2br]
MLYSQGDYAREQLEDEQPDVGRTAFRRDYGRLLHSPAARRLQGKTQLFPGHESDFFRNRLTHSLEVAQIAKDLAIQVNVQCPAYEANPIDVDLVEFAGLAHDLGHPPFGHNGEKALDDCMKQFGGFEGNAQTLRILSTVEKKVVRSHPYRSPETPFDDKGRDVRLGLNLTYRTLASVLKYDHEIKTKRVTKEKLEKGYYASEAALVARIKMHVGEPTKGKKFKTIECQLMDVADDIAYSTFDLEDSMKGGFTHPLAILTKIHSNQKLVEGILKKLRKEVPEADYFDVFDAFKDLFHMWEGEVPEMGYVISKKIANDGFLRTAFTSELIGNFMRGISVNVKTDSQSKFGQVEIRPDIKIKIEVLKHFNYLVNIMSPRLKVVEYRGYELVKTIFKMLTTDGGYQLLPDDVQQMYLGLKGKAAKYRVVCDFVAGMTDRYAIEFYNRLKETGPSIYKPI